MDPREAMELSGSAYFMERGMAGTGSESGPGVQGSPGIQPLSNMNVSFQSNTGGNSIGSMLPVEPSSSISPHGVNVGAPAAMQPTATGTVRRKRGRPRKYGPISTVSLALSPTSSTPPVMVTPTQKRGRGRPPGSGRKQKFASLGEWLSGSAGMGFTPHVITVAAGEDITTKLMSFSQQGPRAMCVLSANGSVSTVTLCQPSTSSGSVTYEGRFEILCLSGSYMFTDNVSSRGRTGGLSVSLATPDGHVIGGGVGGVLIAASPVQVIVGSFLRGSSKAKNKARGGLKGSGDLDRRMAANPFDPASIPPSQNLVPTSLAGAWPDSRPMDMQNAHIDIDLMRE